LRESRYLEKVCQMFVRCLMEEHDDPGHYGLVSKQLTSFVGVIMQKILAADSYAANLRCHHCKELPQNFWHKALHEGVSSWCSCTCS
jgi:hypothetical protein